MMLLSPRKVKKGLRGEMTDMTGTSSDAREAAETVALRALAWIGQTEDLMGIFLGSSGLSSDELPERLSDPVFLAAVLDFLMLDDAWVEGFAAEAGLPPDRIAALRQALPGGDLPNWT